VFVIDPLENFNPEAESTLFMMREAQERAYGIFCVTLPNLSLSTSHALLGERARVREASLGELWGEGQEIEILGIGQKPFYRIKKNLKLNLGQAAAIFLRKDPPFDLAYLHHLYLLAQLRGRVYFMNDPLGVLALSEKIFPLGFEDFVPPTCITRSFEEAKNFAKRQKPGIVMKPLNSSGGRGIFRFQESDSNFKVAFELLSREGAEFVVCQRYLPEVKKGDKRVILLGGEILGYFLRVPVKGSHRANLHSGGQLKKCTLSAREKEISLQVGRSLVQWGIDFAGIDLIGESLTEVNVTSPMGIREINFCLKKHSEKLLMDFVEQRLRHKNASKN